MSEKQLEKTISPEQQASNSDFKFESLCDAGRILPALDNYYAIYDSGEMDADLRVRFEVAMQALESAVSQTPGEFARNVVDAIGSVDIEMVDSSYFDVKTFYDSVLRVMRAEGEFENPEKEFALGIIEGVRDVSSKDGAEATRLLVGKLDYTVIGGSPNIFDHVGNLDDQIDVAVSAQEVPELHRAVWEIREGAMQGVTFARDPSAVHDLLLEKVATATPLRQLELLKFYESLSHHATSATYGDKAAYVLRDVFRDASESSNALTGILARQYESDVNLRLYDDMAATGNRGSKLGQYEKFGLSGRVSMPEEWGGKYQAAHIARDTIGARDAYGVIRKVAKEPGFSGEISNSEVVLGNISHFLTNLERSSDPEDFFMAARQSLVNRLDDEAAISLVSKAHDGYELREIVESLRSNYLRDVTHLTQASFIDIDKTRGGLSPDDVRLIQIVHQPATREALESATGLKMADIRLESQFQLLEYMIRRTPEEFSRLATTAEDLSASPEDVAKFYEAFLATEFGDDFGDMILEIAENQDAESSHEVFDALAKIRESSEMISRHYESDVEGFADAYQVAWNKRTAELLATISDATVDEQERGDAVATLKLVAYAATEVAKANDGEFTMAEASADVGHATLRSVGGAVTKTIRPTGRAPRIGDTAKIPKEMIPESAIGKDKRLSIRLDFDEYGLSLDIGSIARDGVNVSGVAGFVAEQLAKGELRLMTRRQMRDISKGAVYRPTTVTLHGNHVREAFEGIEIDARKFAELVVEHAETLKLATERP